MGFIYKVNGEIPEPTLPTMIATDFPTLARHINVPSLKGSYNYTSAPIPAPSTFRLNGDEYYGATNANGEGGYTDGPDEVILERSNSILKKVSQNIVALSLIVFTLGVLP